MVRNPIDIWFDFVDPLSYLAHRELQDAEAAAGVRIQRLPLEVVLPPAPLTDHTDPIWSQRWAVAEAVAVEGGVPVVEPARVAVRRWLARAARATSSRSPRA